MTNGRFAKLATREERRRAWMRKVVLASLFPLLSMIDPALGAPFVDPSSGHSYELIEEGKTWSDARATAAAMNGSGKSCHLATITSQAEDDFVVAQLPSDTDMWIGGRQRSNLGCNPDDNDPSYWGTWVTGEEWSFTNWATGEGEPDDCDEQCLAYGEDEPILWENGVCDEDDIGGFLVECQPVNAAAPVLDWVGMLVVMLGLAGIGTYRLRRTKHV